MILPWGKYASFVEISFDYKVISTNVGITGAKVPKDQGGASGMKLTDTGLLARIPFETAYSKTCIKKVFSNFRVSGEAPS